MLSRRLGPTYDLSLHNGKVKVPAHTARCGGEHMSKTFPAVTPVIAVITMVAISMTALSFQALPQSDEPGISGAIISPASAMEYQTIEKEVGQVVHIMAEIKNTGDVETVFVIVAKWREFGTEEWETAGIADAVLSPGHLETLVVGYIECTETMVNKKFDVKLILYQAETEKVLDEKAIELAWHVKEIAVSGTLTGFWVE